MDAAQSHHWNKEYIGDAARKEWEADLVPEVKDIMQPEDSTLICPVWRILAAR